MDVVIVDAGLALAFLGIVSALRPLRWLGIRTRGLALLVFLAGAGLVCLGGLLPTGVTRSPTADTRIDDVLPVYQFHEVHSCQIRASPERVFRAIREVTPLDIRFFIVLNWIRSPLASGRSQRSALASRPILDSMTRGGFLILKDESPRELVVGTIAKFWSGEGVVTRTPEEFVAFGTPDYAKAVLNFRVEDEGHGTCRLSTETRILPTDPGAARKFAFYWRVIYPGSWIIRYEWLAAIRRRAEGPQT